MTSPRIEVDLNKIRQNTRCLVDRLKSRGIDVTGVTKAVCGHPKIAQAMLDGGVVDLAEARVSNVQRLRQAGITAQIRMIRAPMLSQADQITQLCDTSFNTEMTVITAIAAASLRTGKPHSIILMVEMGDMREGIMPQDLPAFALAVAEIEGIELKGIAANYACLSGVRPSDQTMRSFSDLANTVEKECGPIIESVSGGNSANLSWALGPESIGRINNLRLGEAILLGIDPVSGEQIGGLYTDAFTMVSEVIETKAKPENISIAHTEPALGELRIVPECSDQVRSIVALGKQDTDIVGLRFPHDVTCLGSTSDHLVVTSKASLLSAGAEIRLGMNYSALMRSMAAPDIETRFLGDTEPQLVDHTDTAIPFLQLV